MKRLHPLPVALSLALALAAPLGFSAPSPAELQSALEAIPVDLNISTPTPLQDAVAMVTPQLPQRPSVVYKPGAESLPVPVMVVEQVRFADLLSALEDLLPVRFTIKNPTPKAGESSLLIVESAGRPTPFATSGLGGGIPFSSTRPRRPTNESEFVVRGASTATDDLALPNSPGPAGGVGGSSALGGASFAAEEPRALPSGSATTRSDLDLPELAAAWIQPDPGLQLSVTRTFAIGSLGSNDGGPSSDDIIEAINLVWSTADQPAPEGNDAPRVAFHPPSGLLIIKAPPSWQALAEEVISNLVTAHREEQQRRFGHGEVKIMEERFQREAEHSERLNEILLERLKAEHSAEVDRLRVKVQELESQISVLDARLKAGG